MEVALAYDRRTTLATSLGAAALDFAANLFRRPVSFGGRVRDPLLLRQLLLALHQSVLSDQRFDEDAWLRQTLDPVITVHHDQLFFEAFSGDQSSYARLSAPLTAFETEGEVRYGTTNVNFTWGLRAALQSLRSARRTVLRVGASGLGVTTATGARTLEHFERKVDVPDSWVKGFLQVQGALAMPAFVFDAHPADLLTLIAYFQDNKPPAPPHGLRYELRPGEPISAVLEPWERRFTLRDTHYDGYTRTVRLWGRKRLELLQGVLPYADRVTIGVLGRGLPHIYVCHCGPYQFLLALSGWTNNDWSKDAAFDLLAPRATPDAQRLDRIHAYLGEHLAATVPQMAANTGLSAPEIEQVLFQLCRAGRAMVDPITSQYRLRELFAEPLDMDVLFAPDPRLAAAERLLAEARVTLRTITLPDQDQRHETRAIATVADEATTYEVTASIDETGRLRFGRCGCLFFQHNLMSRGPCAHIMATRLALETATAAPTPNR